MERPEQKKTAHDLSDVFNPSNAVPSSEALTNQQDRGQMNGFDFYRDLLGATRPGMTFDDLYRASVANKPQVMATQRRLLESRYDLEPKLDPVVTMSRGKPLAVGPTARLPAGMTWEALAALSPAEIRERDIFPYKALPHAAQGGGLGGQVFPQMQIKFRGWSGTMSSSTSRRPFCLSSRRGCFCKTGPSWATSPEARWSRSTTITVCSKTS